VQIINSISTPSSINKERSIYKKSFYSSFLIPSKKTQYIFFCYCLEKKITYSEYLFLKKNKTILLRPPCPPCPKGRAGRAGKENYHHESPFFPSSMDMVESKHFPN